MASLIDHSQVRLNLHVVTRRHHRHRLDDDEGPRDRRNVWRHHARRQQHFADWHTFYAKAIDNHSAAFDRAVLFVDDEGELYSIGNAPTSSQDELFIQDQITGALAALGQPAKVHIYRGNMTAATDRGNLVDTASPDWESSRPPRAGCARSAEDPSRPSGL